MKKGANAEGKRKKRIRGELGEIVQWPRREKKD
jgi:hypothetical protein